jgi:hypothetical protein
MKRVRLLCRPDKLALVLAQFLTQSVTRFNHEFVQMTSEIGIKEMVVVYAAWKLPWRDGGSGFGGSLGADDSTTAQH